MLSYDILCTKYANEADGFGVTSEIHTKRDNLVVRGLQHGHTVASILPKLIED
jgi:hypothetical protein